MSDIIGYYNYAVVIILMMIGLFVVFATRNLIKKLVGLSVFQTSVFLLYITIGKVKGGQPPILVGGHGDDHGDSYGDANSYGAEAATDAAYSDAAETAEAAVDYAATHGADHAEVLYSNPLPHVLILTAIVVGVAVLAIGLALIVRIREVYGTVEEDEINDIDYAYNLEGTDA